MAKGKFYPRSAWAQRNPVFRPLSLPTPEGWQHHTGFHSVPGEGEAALIQWIRNFENNELIHDPSLIAIAYHRMIISGGPHDGARIETRPWGFQGGATGGRNSISHAICITGNFQNEQPTAAALQAAAYEWADAIKKHKVSAGMLVRPHRDAPGNSTACCGTNLINKLPAMRQRIVKIVAGKITAPVVPGPAHPATQFPTLVMGSKGSVVRVWQSFLNQHAGARLTTDGIFGPATRQATINFQRFFKLPADGVVGPQTWGMMEVIVQHRS